MDKYTELLASLKHSEVLITATRRLATFLQREYAEIKSREGKAVWIRPEIFSFSSWLKQNFKANQNFAHPLLLSMQQEYALWQRVIQESSTLSVENVSTAKLAREALNLIYDWQLPFPFPATIDSENPQLFQRLAILFQRYCRENHWLTGAELSGYLSQQFQSGKLTPPKKIILMGFIELNKANQTLLQTLQDAGTCVEFYPDNFYANQISRLELDTVDREISTMARWAKTTVEAYPNNSFIGCIVPNLEQRRSIVQQAFRSVFEESGIAFALSAPSSLDKFPLIQILFKLFVLGENRIDLTDLALLLRTPFIGGANTEWLARARLEMQIRKLAGSDVSMDNLLQLAGQVHEPFYCPLFLQQVSNFRALFIPANNGKFLPSVFAEKLLECLDTLGWPGERQLINDEIEILQRFHQALREFAALDTIYGAISWKKAWLKFESMARQILFQPQLDEFARVQILGTLEPAGMLFTHLWVMGLNDNIWPAAPKPNPFIPLPLQRQFALPHSSAVQELKFSQRLTQQFCQMAAEIIFSSAKQDKEIQLSPSRLVEEFVQIDSAQFNLIEDLSQTAMVVPEERLEYLTDDYGPPVPLGERIKGGTYLFELQSICPFRAFAVIRLHAKPQEETHGFLSSKEKGTLLHRAFELIWKTLEHHQNLLALTQSTIHQLVLSSVVTAMTEMYEHRLDKLAQGFWQVEQNRLVNLIEKWLYLQEKPRSTFKIAALELAEQVELMGYSFRIKIDRVDELYVDQKRIIIDYKSGLVDKKDWFGQRPDKPQLPLYCVTGNFPVYGVLFAQVKTGQLKFKGLVEEGIEIDDVQILSHDDWEKQQYEWKGIIENLAAEFVSGCAKVDPKESENTCRFCELKLLCRVSE